MAQTRKTTAFLKGAFFFLSSSMIEVHKFQKVFQRVGFLAMLWSAWRFLPVKIGGCLLRKIDLHLAEKNPSPKFLGGKSRKVYTKKLKVTQTQLLGGGFNCFLNYHVFPNFQEWTFRKPWENANLVFSNHPLEMIEFLKVFCRWNLVAFGTFSSLTPQNRNWWRE